MIDDEEEEEGEDLIGDGMEELVHVLILFYEAVLRFLLLKSIKALIFLQKFRDYRAIPHLDVYDAAELADERERVRELSAVSVEFFASFLEMLEE